MGSVGSVGQPGKVQPCDEEEYAYQPSGTPMYPPGTEEILPSDEGLFLPSFS